MKALYTFLLFILFPLSIQAQDVYPILEYVTALGDGTYVATWGYNNTSSQTINIPIGNNDNRFTPAPQFRGQPLTFLPGRHVAVFNMPLTYGTSNKWHLRNRSDICVTKNVTLKITDNTVTMPLVGSNLTYTLTYKNGEKQNYTGAVLKDTLPAGTEFVSATGGGTHSGGIVTWNLNTINGNGTSSVQVTVKVTQDLPSYKNRAFISGSISTGVRAYAEDINKVNAITIVNDSYIAAFEDLKRTGWNDWDVNDFVASVKSQIEVNGQGYINKITYDYEALARGSSFDHIFGHIIKLQGTSTVSLTVKDTLGNPVPAWSFSNQSRTGTFSVNIFQSTRTAIPPAGSSSPFANVSPSQVNVVKGYTATLTIVPTQNLNLNQNFTGNSTDPFILTSQNQNIHIASIAGTLGNTQNVDAGNSSPVFGYYLDLAYELPFNWKWPYEGPQFALWSSFPDFPEYIQSSHLVNTNWYNSPDLSKVWTRRIVTDNSPFKITKKPGLDYKLQHYGGYDNFTDSADIFFASPKLVDIDNDNKLETVIGSFDGKLYAYKSDGTQMPGFPVQTDDLIRSTVAIDKRTDGVRIYFGNKEGKFYGVNEQGALMPGYPVNVGGPVKSSPVVTDINGDGNKEVILFSGNGMLYAFTENGSTLQGFPVKVQNTLDQFGNFIIQSSPAVSDLNGDGQKEIIVCTADSTVKAIGSNGQTLFTTQLDNAVYSSPVIIKINDSFKILVTSSGGKLFILDAAGNINTSRQFDAGFISSPVTADLNNDGNQEIIAASVEGSLYNISADNIMQTNWTVEFAQEIVASPIVADIDGDNYLDLIIGVHNGFLVGLDKDGALLDSLTSSVLEPFDSWIISTPAIGDIDGNGKLDIVAASFDKRIRSVEMPLTNPNSRIWWSSFGGNIENTRVNVSVRKENITELPVKFSISQNYPNPFNPTTGIRYEIPVSSLVRLNVYDITGRQVMSIVNSKQEAGVYTAEINMAQLSSGVYYYRIEAGSFIETKKMVLVK